MKAKRNFRIKYKQCLKNKQKKLIASQMIVGNGDMQNRGDNQLRKILTGCRDVFEQAYVNEGMATKQNNNVCGKGKPRCRMFSLKKINPRE